MSETNLLQPFGLRGWWHILYIITSSSTLTSSSLKDQRFVNVHAQTGMRDCAVSWYQVFKMCLMDVIVMKQVLRTSPLTECLL